MRGSVHKARQYEKTMIGWLQPTHDFLHEHSSLYQHWHQWPDVHRIHWAALLLVVVSVLTTVAGVVWPAGATTLAASGINRELPFRGVLRNADGTIVADGTYTMTFRLYNQATDGSAAWIETHDGANQIVIDEGVFTTNLGALTTLAGVNFNEDTWYLGITIGDDSQLIPRIRLGAAPYAANADTLDGRDETSFLLLTGRTGGQSIAGQITLGDNTGTVSINSSDWDISTDGALTGVALDANGTGNTLTNVEGADLVADTLDFAQIKDSASLDATTSVTTGDNDFKLNIGSGTTSGAFTVEDTATSTRYLSIDNSAVTLTSNTWGISSAGAATGIASITRSGNFALTTTGGGTATFTIGGNFDVDLASGNEDMNILDGNLVIGNANPTVLQDGEDLYVEGSFEVDGTSRFDSTVTTTAQLAINGSALYTLTGTNNVVLNHSLSGGTVTVFDLQAVPSTTAGATIGFGISQINSTNTNGLDTAFRIDNADTDLVITDAVSITNSGGGNFTNYINAPNFDVDATGKITVAVNGGLDTSAAGVLFIGNTTSNEIQFSKPGNLSHLWGSSIIENTFFIGNTSAQGLTRYDEATSTIDIADTVTATCTQSGDIALAGAALGDGVVVNSNLALGVNTFLTGHVTAANTVRIQFCNLSGGNVNPAEATYTVRLFR